MNIFFISDTHFGHQSPYTKFMLADGCTLSRPHGSAEAGDQAMEENWNKTVRPTDKVYHLGDIAMSKKHLPILERLNGEKVLIKGNHDLEKASVYLKYFKDIRGSHQFDGVLLTHIPVHPSSLARWGFNIHGHLHTNRVMWDVYDGDIMHSNAEIDPRYYCVSVEQINYTPISLEEVKKHKPALELSART
jgi:calcineurin-like phosphoesterase family protein